MTQKIQALIAFAVMTSTAMLPAVAWACPYCVSQNKDAGLAGVALLGSMIGLSACKDPVMMEEPFTESQVLGGETVSA